MVNKTGDSSYHKLKWNIKGVFDNFPAIEKALENRLNQVPENNLKERRKIASWIGQIKKIDENIHNIKKSRLAELERNINLEIDGPSNHSLFRNKTSLENRPLRCTARICNDEKDIIDLLILKMFLHLFSIR